LQFYDFLIYYFGCFEDRQGKDDITNFVRQTLPAKDKTLPLQLNNFFLILFNTSSQN